jgi:hypothetical protein
MPLSDLAALLSGGGGTGGGLMGLGQVLQDQDQKYKNAHMVKMKEDWEKLQMLFTILQGLAGLGGTRTTDMTSTTDSETHGTAPIGQQQGGSPLLGGLAGLQAGMQAYDWYNKNYGPSAGPYGGNTPIG